MASDALNRMHELIHRFEAHLRPIRSARTVATYVKVAKAFAKSRSTQTMPERRDVEDFLALPLQKGTLPAVATRNQVLAALRALSQYAVDEGVWSLDPTRRVTTLREPRRNKPVFFRPEIHRFFHAVDEASEVAFRSRDRAILAVLFTMGLRGSELVGLNVEQVDFLSATILEIYGKGGTVCDLPVEPKTLALLRVWLLEREKLAHAEEHALFISSRGTRLSLRTLERLFKRLMGATGTKKNGTPHTARHSTATNILLLGTDVAVTGDVLRHADLNTTREYLHLIDAQRRRAIGTLSTMVPEAVLPSSPPSLDSAPPDGQMSLKFHEFGDEVTINVSPANDLSVDDQCGLGDVAA
jgi:integrase/recombinase XerC